MSAIGHTKIAANQSYPPSQHPEGRAFVWDRGRVLPSLQLVLIRSGRGQVEWTRERHPIQSGQAFLLLPGHWHRYRPDPEIGWEEDWFELRGPMMERWINQELFLKRVFDCDAENFQQMNRLHHLATESRGAPGVLAGLAMSILAHVSSGQNDTTSSERKTKRHDLVAQARTLLRNGVTVNATTERLGLSYPTLNRTFKELTGLSPKTYARQIRLARAEALVAAGGLTVKEIAAELGYHSPAHFSADFKQTYGSAPKHWRETLSRDPHE